MTAVSNGFCLFVCFCNFDPVSEVGKVESDLTADHEKEHNYRVNPAHLYGEFPPKCDESEITESKPIRLESEHSILASKSQIDREHLTILH